MSPPRSIQMSTAAVVAASFSLTAVAATHAAAPDFEREVRPLLETHCLRCHGPEKQSGGLRFDQKQVALSGGDSGQPALVAGEPGRSQMIQRITSTDKEDQMPPKGPRLPEADIAVLKAWIAAGAVWPESAAVAATSAKPLPGSDHWSFKPLAKVSPPEVNDARWAANPIDRFIHARREKAGLASVPAAPAGAWIRRATYDLTGLPPTAAEVEAFVAQADTSPEAYGQLVDRLLQSPRYGERWGRHWMDWVRYADTAGDNSDYPIPQAYLYRNYIIESFNADLPYDRFLTEQIAGDLLPAKDQAERNRLTVATGYLAMARRFGSLIERYPHHLTIEDTMDNMGRTVMGLTLSCARCHDHKFDPISTRDYYGLYGIFASTRYPMPGLELFQAQRNFVSLLPEPETRARLQPYEEETARLTAAMEKLLAECEARSLENARVEKSVSLDEQRRRKGELDRMLGQARKEGEKLAAHLKKLPPMPTAYAVGEAAPVNARIQLKGEPDRLGTEVPRKFLDVLGGAPLPPQAQTGSGRLELAEWLTDKKNPLTARVMVNRIWQRHFGRGLVPTTSDFGLRGEAPSHPELLDWLAAEFMRSGWSFKHMHRLIMTSQTYRLSSQDGDAQAAADPGNVHYWKFSRQRLDAESLRDTLLFVSGALDLTPQTEPYPIPPAKDWRYTQHHPFKDDYSSQKRSVYLMVKRLTARPYFQNFDGADANVCTSARDSSVTALQALYFFNDAFVHEQAEACAQALLQLGADSERIRHLYITLLAREPSAEESAVLTCHVAAVKKRTGDEPAAWASLCRSLFRLNEFLYLD